MNRRRLPFFVVAGFVVAFLLVWGGVLLGLNPSVRSALHDLLPAGVVNAESTDYSLQQEVLDKLETTYYKSVDESILHEKAIDGMVAALDDPYTVYMDPKEYASFEEQTNGAYSGVGMTVEMSGGQVTIVATFKGSPAEQAGIKPGDIIVSVDGTPTEGQTLDEVVGRIKGTEGSSVKMSVYRPAVPATTTTTVAAGSDSESTTESTSESDVENQKAAGASELPPGGETKDYTLVRKTIEVPVTESTILTAGTKKVALISFFTFSDGSGAELRDRVKQAVDVDKVDAIILDLRSNGGGLLDEAINVASIFIPKGVIVTTEGLHSPKETYDATGGAYTSTPLYVLTDRFTASASEIVSGALQDDKRATLIGETTFGKGLVQTLEPLSNGGAIKVTTAVYLTPKGRNINKQGIAPDITAPDDQNTPDVDEGVQAALKLIGGVTTSAR